MLARSSQNVKRVAARNIICCSFFRVLDSNFVWKWMGFCHLVFQWLSSYYLLLPLQFVKICFPHFWQVLGTGCLADWKSVWILWVDHLFMYPPSSFISALWFKLVVLWNHKFTGTLYNLQTKAKFSFITYHRIDFM